MAEERPARALIQPALDQGIARVESDALRTAIANLADRLAPTRYALDFSAGERYEKDALVVAISKSLISDRGAGLTALPVDPPGKRVDELTKVLWSVVRENPAISTKHVWAVLARELDSGEPRHDRHCIVVGMSGDKFVYRTRANVEKDIGWEGFESRVKRLRKAARELGTN
jgi:hypothetical protein